VRPIKQYNRITIIAERSKQMLKNPLVLAAIVVVAIIVVVIVL
jgi:hypothetical protein